MSIKDEIREYCGYDADRPMSDEEIIEFIQGAPYSKAYRVKPEYWDLWGADADCNTVTLEDIVEWSGPNEWDKPIEELLEQVEEVMI